MGRIIVQVHIQNPAEEEKAITVSAFVDTGAASLALPLEWKDRLGEFPQEEQVDLWLADNSVIQGLVCAPAAIQIEGFRKIYNEVLFLDMASQQSGDYEPLLGYIPLEQSQAAVDMLGHRLIPVKYIDCK